MSWRVSVISGTTEVYLDDGDIYRLTGINGIGMVPLERIVESGPMQHGDSDVGYRLRARVINLAIIAKGGTDSDWFQCRDALLRLFRPADSALKLRIADIDMVRQIDCHFAGAMEMTPEVGIAPRWQRLGIQLRAPDPTFYDPEGESVMFVLGVGTEAMEVPLEVPWMVGVSAIAASAVCVNPGSWLAYPTIAITGPIDDAILTNETIGEKLDFSGTTIPAGVDYVIDCRYGRKTVVRSSDGANRVGDLTEDSNLATFRIDSDPDAPGGINVLSLTGAGANANTRVVVQYNARYLGV